MLRLKSYRRRVPTQTICLLSIVVTCSLFAMAQQGSPNKQKPVDEHTAPGKLISAGKNSTPVGPLKAKTYRLEEVKLEKPVQYQTPDGEKAVLESVFRLTITLDSLPDNDYIIWLDGLPLTAYASGDARVGGENAVSVLLYGQKFVAPNGATLAISTYSQRTVRSTLPEKLALPDNLVSTATMGGACTKIESIRSVLRISKERRTPMVEVVIQCPEGLPILNSDTTLMVDDKVFGGGVSGTQAVFQMTVGEFVALKDGSPVFLRHGPLTIILGRLNKSMLDR